ncbi:hypothetical protein VNO77_01056 [Canavalia gladiata]|uniref:Uncharacterized protein n=1 Tax=Canavalia gladiata TaxID=3824 RepID=A0AAN9MQI9_CANGL
MPKAALVLVSYCSVIFTYYQLHISSIIFVFFFFSGKRGGGGLGLLQLARSPCIDECLDLQIPERLNIIV